MKKFQCFALYTESIYPEKHDTLEEALKYGINKGWSFYVKDPDLKTVATWNPIGGTHFNNPIGGVHYNKSTGDRI